MSRSVQQQQQQPIKPYLAEVQKTTASFDISKQNLHDSLITILNTCNLRVYGYNSYYDAFWGKKTQENGGQYSFELSLISITTTNTQVAIETLMGNQYEAIEIIASIKEALCHTQKPSSQLPVARTSSARVIL
jgi:hypothetical protein